MGKFNATLLRGHKVSLATLIIFVVFGSIGSFAIMPPIPIVAEVVTSVDFASPDRVGTYYFQILYDGKVQSIDNKNKLIELGTLSSNKVNNLKNAINEIPSDIELIPGGGDRCYDAPSFTTNVYKSNGDKVTISTKIACVNNLTNSYIANDIDQWLHQFKYTMENEFNRNSSMSFIKLLGQEGYGAPYPSEPVDEKRHNFSCKSVQGEIKLNLKLREKRESQRYVLDLERFLEGVNPTPYRETFLVSKFVSSRPGAAVVYKDAIDSIKLKILFTATPRADGKLYAQLEKIDDDIVLNYSLLCTRF